MYETPAALARQLDAQLMRENAYRHAINRLQAGEIRQPEAVTALRRAYHRAERHARHLTPERTA